MLSTSSKELGNRLQTPTLIGCIFLRIKLLRISSFRFSSLRSAKPSILAQFLSNWQNFFSFLLQQHYQLGSTAFCRASNYTSLFTAANSKPENFSNHSQQPTQPSTRGFSPPATRRAPFCAVEPASIHREMRRKDESAQDSLITKIL